MIQLEHCTVAQAATALGVSRWTVIRMVNDGVLVPAAKLPTRTGAYLFEPAEVERVRQERAA